MQRKKGKARLLQPRPRPIAPLQPVLKSNRPKRVRSQRPDTRAAVKLSSPAPPSAVAASADQLLQQTYMSALLGKHAVSCLAPTARARRLRGLIAFTPRRLPFAPQGSTTLGVVIIYCCCSSLMLIVNKLAVHHIGAPAFVTWLQVLVENASHATSRNCPSICCLFLLTEP